VGAIVKPRLGGQAVTQVYEGERKFDLVVRWAEPYRRTCAAIRQILVPRRPDARRFHWVQLATIAEEDGPSVIYREDNRRYAPVKFPCAPRSRSTSGRRRRA